MKMNSIKALNQIRTTWEELSDGPLVTMDAGPNIHLLFREDQSEFIDKFINMALSGFKVL